MKMTLDINVSSYEVRSLIAEKRGIPLEEVTMEDTLAMWNTISNKLSTQALQELVNYVPPTEEEMNRELDEETNYGCY
jgi:hypothetical protein